MESTNFHMPDLADYTCDVCNGCSGCNGCNRYKFNLVWIIDKDTSDTIDDINELHTDLFENSSPPDPFRSDEYDHV